MSKGELTVEPPAGTVDSKGLKGGALGLLSSIVVGMASTAPAYSLAASLGLIVASGIYTVHRERVRAVGDAVGARILERILDDEIRHVAAGAKHFIAWCEKHGETLEDPITNMAEFEQERTSGAIRTDFILSAEIMAIALAEVAGEPLLNRAIILAVVGVVITVAVYGAVALIVKMDDVGLHLAAIVFYWWVKKENLVVPMITGKKRREAVQTIARPPWLAPLLIAAVVVLRSLRRLDRSAGEIEQERILITTQLVLRESCGPAPRAPAPAAAAPAAGAGAAGRGPHGSRGAHHGARPHPARRLADGLRPRARHAVRPEPDAGRAALSDAGGIGADAAAGGLRALGNQARGRTGLKPTADRVGA